MAPKMFRVSPIAELGIVMKMERRTIRMDRQVAMRLAYGSINTRADLSTRGLAYSNIRHYLPLGFEVAAIRLGLP